MGAERQRARVQSQYEDFFECGDCRAGYIILDMCRMGVCNTLEMEQHTVERMGEERQGEIPTN